MKKIVLFFLLAISTSFAQDLVLHNETSYPIQKSKIGIQWATSAKEIEESNQAITAGTKLNPDTIQLLSQSGKVHLTVPKKAEYFRLLVWSTGEGEPDLLTNWVDIVPNKTYTLKPDHLFPSVLMAGIGC